MSWIVRSLQSAASNRRPCQGTTTKSYLAYFEEEERRLRRRGAPNITTNQWFRTRAIERLPLPEIRDVERSVARKPARL